MPYHTNDYQKVDVRASAILTNSYVAGSVIGPGQTNDYDCHRFNQLILLISFTIGSLTDGRVKVEYSHDGTTFFQETFLSTSGTVATASLGEYKMTATGNYQVAIPLRYRYIKISAMGTGTVTNSLMEIDALLGNN